jgi:hypothetical protein
VRQEEKKEKAASRNGLRKGNVEAWKLMYSQD